MYLIINLGIPYYLEYPFNYTYYIICNNIKYKHQPQRVRK